MPGLMADHDLEGQFAALLRLFEIEPLSKIWTGLEVSVESFETLGLSTTVADRTLWTVCPQRQIVLVTGNRNRRGADSLEATIQDSNKPESLPVLTIANLGNMRDRVYAERVADRLLKYLLVIDSLRGAGRLYLP